MPYSISFKNENELVNISLRKIEIVRILNQLEDFNNQHKNEVIGLDTLIKKLSKYIGE